MFSADSIFDSVLNQTVVPVNPVHRIRYNRTGSTYPSSWPHSCSAAFRWSARLWNAFCFCLIWLRVIDRSIRLYNRSGSVLLFDFPCDDIRVLNWSLFSGCGNSLLFDIFLTRCPGLLFPSCRIYLWRPHRNHRTAPRLRYVLHLKNNSSFLCRSW